MRLKLSLSPLLNASLALALSAALTWPEAAAAQSGGKSGVRTYRMEMEGRSILVRRIASEPLVTATGARMGGQPALRIGGVADRDQALRAIEAFCGMAAGEMKDFGAYGDPFWFDRKQGDYVVWFDCAPGKGQTR